MYIFDDAFCSGDAGQLPDLQPEYAVPQSLNLKQEDIQISTDEDDVLQTSENAPETRDAETMDDEEIPIPERPKRKRNDQEESDEVTEHGQTPSEVAALQEDSADALVAPSPPKRAKVGSSENSSTMKLFNTVKNRFSEVAKSGAEKISRAAQMGSELKAHVEPTLTAVGTVALIAVLSAGRFAPTAAYYFWDDDGDDLHLGDFRYLTTSIDFVYPFCFCYNISSMKNLMFFATGESASRSLLFAYEWSE